MANLIKTYDQLEAYIQKINTFSILTKEEEMTLARRLVDEEDPEAAASLINANLRFVVKIAYQYRNYGFKISDLIQEGNYGLIMAVKKFDPDKGFRLITYAVWWIKAYIKNYIINNWSLIKVGTTQAQKKLFFKLKEEMRRNDMMMLNGHNVKLLSERFNVRDEDIVEMDQRISKKDFHLDRKISVDGKGTSHLDLLPDHAPDIEERLISSEQISRLNEKLKEAYQILTETEQIIYNKRLISEKPNTLQELGKELGISRERVRQIEVRIKKKIQKYLETACDGPIEL